MSVSTPEAPTDAPPEVKRARFRVDTPATKAATASDGTIQLNGWASTWAEDRDAESVAKDAFDDTWENYRAKNPMLLYQHNPDWPLGQITEGGKDRTGLAVVGEVPKPPEGSIPELITAYHGIERGFLKTFSIGGFMEKAIRAGKRVITKVELLEISVVSIPANPDSIFVAAVKALNDEPMAELSPAARAQMEQLLGFQPLVDAELKALSPEEVDDHWAALSDLFTSTYGVPPPPREAWTKVLRARDGGVAVAIVAKAGVEVVRAFYQPEAPSLQDVEQKAGRSLSRENEHRLRTARDHIDGVLQAVAPPPPPPEDDTSSSMGGPLDNLPHAGRMAATGYHAQRAQARDAKSYRDLQTALESAIREQQPDPDHDGDEVSLSFVEDFADDWVVYYHDGELYQAPYTRADGGEITLGDPKIVQARTSYVELTIDFDHEGNPIVDAGQKGALPVRGLAIADRERAWDAGAAKDRLKSWAGADDAPNAKYGQGFLYRDGDGSNFGDYRFPVADVIDGSPTYVPKAIFAAAAIVQGGRGGVDESVASAIKPKLTTLYGKLRAKFDDDTLTPPWADSKGEA